MRALLASVSFTIFALPAFADNYLAAMKPVAATVYTQGARVTYAADVNLVGGVHQISFPLIGIQDGNLPRLKTSGAVQIGAINIVPVRNFDEETLLTPVQKKAFDAVEAANDAVDAQQVKIRAVGLQMEALEMQRGFLATVNGSGADNPDADQMRALAQMIRDEAEAAVARRLELEAQMRGLDKDLKLLNNALSDAQQAYERTSPLRGVEAFLVATVTVVSPIKAQFQMEQFVDQAEWSLEYDFRLSTATRTGGAPKLSVERKISVMQQTGQAWPDIDLVLSTANPNAQSAPGRSGNNVAMIFDPEIVMMEPSMAFERAASPMLQDMVAVVGLSGFASMALQTDGLSISYTYPSKVTLGNQELLQLTLDNFDLPITTSLKAVPRYDETAFLMAEVTNDTKEPLLAGVVSLFRDGAFIGKGALAMMPAGGDAEMAFGSMDGIRLKYTSLRRETGDTGIISTSNTREDVVEFSVENLTGETQEVRALFALPYSEQEDLEVSNRIRPNPNEVDVEDVRGVGAWDLVIPAGETETVRVSTSLSWPEGQELDWTP